MDPGQQVIGLARGENAGLVARPGSAAWIVSCRSDRDRLAWARPALGDLQGLGDLAPVEQVGRDVVEGPERGGLLAEDLLEARVVDQGGEFRDRRRRAGALVELTARW